MNSTDRRGVIDSEWIAENDVVIANKGEKSTFYTLTSHARCFRSHHRLGSQ